MAKDLSIKQDGVSSSFNAVDIVNTNNIDANSTDWVPEDEVKTKVKTITDNGTYIAANEGCIGYSVVYVNVQPATSRQVTGVDIRDGKTYLITVDDNGYIVRTLLYE